MFVVVYSTQHKFFFQMWTIYVVIRSTAFYETLNGQHIIPEGIFSFRILIYESL